MCSRANLKLSPNSCWVKWNPRSETTSSSSPMLQRSLEKLTAVWHVGESPFKYGWNLQFQLESRHRQLGGIKCVWLTKEEVRTRQKMVYLTSRKAGTRNRKTATSGVGFSHLFHLLILTLNVTADVHSKISCMCCCAKHLCCAKSIVFGSLGPNSTREKYKILHHHR